MATTCPCQYSSLRLKRTIATAKAVVSLFLLLLLAWTEPGQAAPDRPEDFEIQLDRLKVVAEIDPVTELPTFEYPARASVVTNLLGRPARVLPVTDSPKAMAWTLGHDCGLKPGSAYLLSIEFPDDVPRGIFIANRGADQVRGFATGSATGDARQQYAQPSLESVNYPQTHQWQHYRSLFVLNHHFQGLKAQRDPKPGGRPFGPADGFQVIVFQLNHLDDPRSHGVAVGRIRLHAVPDLKGLSAPIAFPPADLPRRRIFFREEMGDEPPSAAAPEDRAVLDPVDWYLNQARLIRVLGFNTFSKDLLEFGFNQGWESGDPNWFMNAQPPLTDLWQKLLPRLAAEELDVLPYYEYKGALGLPNSKPLSLGWQRRAEKLYHGQPNTNYTGIWWVERHNADLTDPETLLDAKRLLDRTIGDLKDKAHFVGAWFRTRGNHLPISFADAALGRFGAAHPKDASRKVTRAALIESYAGDQKLYLDYVNWWLDRRRDFLASLQQHLAATLKDTQTQLLFTPWPGEPVPLLRDPRSGKAGHPDPIVTDAPAWWEALARSQPDSSWWRWALVPAPFDVVIQENHYRQSLDFHEPISPLPWRSEDYHAAPGADPERYRALVQVMITFPIGRLFTVANADLLASFHSAAGLTVIHHFPLNEDNPADRPGPFGGQLGYTCVDVDRAGPHLLLQEARAVANGDARNLGFLCASTFSTGFPGYFRRFNQAFLAFPALPSHLLSSASTDPEVVVREIQTAKHGDYYLVANTSMQSKRRTTVTLPGSGPLRDLVSGTPLPSTPLVLDLYSAELRAYHRSASAR